MIEFFNRIFARHGSGATAKERLRLVLMSDHLSLAPDMVDAMKRDLVDVISRYVEVDRDRIDVHFENQEKTLAMLANIPILSVNRNGSSSVEQAAPAPVPAPVAMPAALEPVAAPDAPGPEGAVAQTATPRPKRKRKSRARKNPAASSAGAPATS